MPFFGRQGILAKTAAAAGPSEFTADGNTKLLLHFNGSDASTTITDDSGTSKTVTASGGAALTTSFKKFGTAGLNLSTTDDIITVSSSTDFNFGTGGFTIEAYVYATSWATSGVDDRVLWEGRNAANGGNGIILYDPGSLGWYVYKNAVLGNTGLGSPSYMQANTWQHVAWSRSGSTSKIFIDGTERASFTDSNNYNFNVNCIIGSDYDSSATRDFIGYIDEFRVSNTGRYTANFTPGE